MEDFAERIAELRVACHRQMGVQRVLQEDTTHLRNAMKVRSGEGDRQRRKRGATILRFRGESWCLVQENKLLQY